jgi:FHS family L-fucose permease-like MFS transporter
MPESRDKDTSLSVWGIIKHLAKHKKYFQGVLSQAFYVGAQIMCWTYIYQYAEAIGIDAETAGNYQFVAFIVFFLGRFICTFLLRYINSGKLLMILSMLAIACSLGTIFITGITGLYCLVAISFCMSLMFPTIYGIALEGLTEDESKIGAAGLVMAIVGGALMPTLQGMVLDIGGSGYTDTLILGVSEVNFSFILPLLCFVWIAAYGYGVFTSKVK